MLLHLSPFLQGKRAGLLEEAGREPNLSDVMDEPAEMHQLLVSVG
jgi:hypothetical protein